MENAVDALKMAAAVLVFILALSISIYAFGEARVASQTILDYNDREFDNTWVIADRSGNKFVTERTVGLETIIPTIYKSYLENYKVVFEGLGNDWLYKKIDGTSKTPQYQIDLVNQTIGGSTESANPKLDFLSILLYGDKDGSKTSQFSNSYEFNISAYPNRNI